MNRHCFAVLCNVFVCCIWLAVFVFLVACLLCCVSVVCCFSLCAYLLVDVVCALFVDAMFECCVLCVACRVLFGCCILCLCVYLLSIWFVLAV